MKKKVKRLALVVCAAIFAVGVIGCIARPSYVREAVSILFQNEISEEDMAPDSELPDSDFRVPITSQVGFNSVEEVTWPC